MHVIVVFGLKKIHVARPRTPRTPKTLPKGKSLSSFNISHVATKCSHSNLQTFARETIAEDPFLFQPTGPVAVPVPNIEPIEPTLQPINSVDVIATVEPTPEPTEPTLQLIGSSDGITTMEATVEPTPEPTEPTPAVALQPYFPRNP